MMQFGLNHMTAPRLNARDLLAMATELGCTGVEFRNDLAGPLFQGEAPEEIGAAARAVGLRILALAEVKAFNTTTHDILPDALAVMGIAKACGAEGIALIPQVATAQTPRAEQRQALRVALDRLQSGLQDYGLIGLIEPLGFATSTLRFKQDVAAALDDLNRPACFALIHDTFHHHLAAEDTIHADLTALVHISGITDPVASDQMTDAHRGLVDGHDRLDNLAQLRALQAAGFGGPISFEAFATEVHQMTQPAAALVRSQEFITSELARKAA